MTILPPDYWGSLSLAIGRKRHALALQGARQGLTRYEFRQYLRLVRLEEQTWTRYVNAQYQRKRYA